MVLGVKQLSNKEFDGHAWNMAKVNDKWYYFDATWGRTGTQEETGSTPEAEFGKILPSADIFDFYFPLPQSKDMDTMKLGYVTK